MPTSNYHSTVNAVSASESPVVLLQIDHPSLAEPVRVVNDRENLTSNGVVYTACGFEVTMPNQPESGAPRAQLRIDNVSRDLVYWIDTSNGGLGATATLKTVLRSDPDTIQFEHTLNLTNVSMTNSLITAQLAYEDIWNAQACQVRYTPGSHPGVF